MVEKLKPYAEISHEDSLANRELERVRPFAQVLGSSWCNLNTECMHGRIFICKVESENTGCVASG